MTPTPTMQADMNWFAVLAHHAVRAPDKAITRAFLERAEAWLAESPYTIHLVGRPWAWPAA